MSQELDFNRATAFVHTALLNLLTSATNPSLSRHGKQLPRISHPKLGSKEAQIAA